MWPQITMLVFSALGFLFTLSKDRGMSEVIATFVAFGFVQFLLYSGGFYAVLVQ